MADDHVSLDGSVLVNSSKMTNGVNHVEAPSPTNGVNNVNGNKLTNRVNHIEAPSPTKRLLVVSAHDEEGIQRNNTRLVDFIDTLFSRDDEPAQEDLLHNLLHTLNERRTRFDWRSHYVVGSLECLKASLRQLPRPTRLSGAPRTLRFVFTGQGANWPGMAQNLMVYPVFRKRIEEAADFLRACALDGIFEVSSYYEAKGAVTCP